MRCQPDIITKVYQWLIINQSCLLCDSPSQRLLAICEECEVDLPWLSYQCRQCALPIPDPQALCADCIHNPPSFSAVLTPFEFTFPLDTLISRFKYQQNWPYGQLLTALLAEHLKYYFDEGGQRPQMLLAIPLAKRRQRQRGYNQAQMICDWLVKSLNINNPKHLLLRTRETVSQQGLNAKARRANLHNAFQITDATQIKDKHIVLVDDVLTTGTTCSIISELLLKLGAARVDVYCLARTGKPHTVQL